MKDPFLLYILLSALVGFLLPTSGTATDVLDLATKIAIFLLFLGYGARLSTAEAWAGLKHWRLHLTIFACTFVVFPLIGLGLLHLPWYSPGLALGLAFLTLVPSTVQSSITFTSIAGGNIAGAIVSGAFFGDKMSPISDTTGISASIVGIDLFEHIRNMMYTTVPAWLISAVVYLWLLPAVAPHDLNGVVAFRQQLEGSGLVHLYSLLPFVLLLGMALMKVDAIVTLMATIFLALVLTYFHSTPSLAELGQWFFKGPSFPEAWGDIAKLLSRGGVESMFFTQTIVILGLSFGGLLFALGVIPALLDGIRSLLTTTGRATFSVAATAVGVNTLIGEQYLSILLSGETFKPVYEKLHLHPRNLSRTLEDAGTVINPLVPWSVCGVFIFNVLGVPVWHYLPYAIFCYMSLVLTLVFGWTGVTLSRVEPKK